MRNLLIAAVVLSATAASAQQQLDLPRPSPFAKASQFIGLTEVTVDYSSPGVKNRKIWGGLVPYGKVWRAGANGATKITFSKDVTIEGKPIVAGTYAFFIEPTATKWTLILSKNANQPGAFAYKKEEDVLRVEVKPQPIAMRERLIYTFSNFTETQGSLDLEWEKVRVSLPIATGTDEQATASIKAFEANGWNQWAQAARYQMEKKRYDDGQRLVDISLQLKETWFGMFVKAQIYKGRNDVKNAMVYLQRAKELGDKDPNFFLKDEVETALKTWKPKS